MAVTKIKTGCCSDSARAGHQRSEPGCGNSPRPSTRLDDLIDLLNLFV
jgi:hypothetical protein